jgi:zinc transport system permease protein
VIVVFLFCQGKILQVTFNEELAISAGTKVFAYNLIFTFLVALTIAVGIKVIGIILMASFLVIPANVAKVIAKSFKQMLLLSAIGALASTFLGLMFAYALDAPSGAMIVICLGTFLIFALLVKSLLKIFGGAG